MECFVDARYAKIFNKNVSTYDIHKHIKSHITSFWEMFCVTSAKTHFYVCWETRCCEYLCMPLTYWVRCLENCVFQPKKKNRIKSWLIVL